MIWHNNFNDNNMRERKSYGFKTEQRIKKNIGSRFYGLTEVRG